MTSEQQNLLREFHLKENDFERQKMFHQIKQILNGIGRVTCYSLKHEKDTKPQCDCVSEGQIKGGLIVGLYMKTSNDKAVVVNNNKEQPMIWESPFSDLLNVPNGPRFNFV